MKKKYNHKTYNIKLNRDKEEDEIIHNNIQGWLKSFPEKQFPDLIKPLFRLFFYYQKTGIIDKSILIEVDNNEL